MAEDSLGTTPSSRCMCDRMTAVPNARMSTSGRSVPTLTPRPCNTDRIKALTPRTTTIQPLAGLYQGVVAATELEWCPSNLHASGFTACATSKAHPLFSLSRHCSRRHRASSGYLLARAARGGGRCGRVGRGRTSQRSGIRLLPVGLGISPPMCSYISSST
jgi:hypothetical protein